MKAVQSLGNYEPQFQEILRNALDRRVFQDVVTPDADVEFSIEHGLGYVPLGFLVIQQDKAGSLYNSTTSWTPAKVFLKCNVATVSMRVMVF